MLSLDKLPGHTKGERILIFMRRHWFIFVSSVALYVLLLILPPIIYWLLVIQGALTLGVVMQALLLLLMSAYYLFVWLFLFNTILDHYLDIWIVTNKRILNIEQEGLFSRTISEQKLERIQDVTSEVIGFLATFLNFGNVYVQTAGKKERFVFKEVPRPTNVVNKILEILEKKAKQNPAVSKSEDKGILKVIKDTLLD